MKNSIFLLIGTMGALILTDVMIASHQSDSAKAANISAQVLRRTGLGLGALLDIMESGDRLTNDQLRGLNRLRNNEVFMASLNPFGRMQLMTLTAQEVNEQNLLTAEQLEPEDENFNETLLRNRNYNLLEGSRIAAVMSLEPRFQVMALHTALSNLNDPVRSENAEQTLEAMADYIANDPNLHSGEDVLSVVETLRTVSNELRVLDLRSISIADRERFFGMVITSAVERFDS